MKIKVEATACDLDTQMPAKTYTVTVDGETHELDLCSPHAQPIHELIEAARQGREEALATTPTAPPVQFTPPSPPPRKAAASSTAAKTPAAPVKKSAAPTKKAGGRRRPKIVSMEEIEKQKAAQQAKG
ncbi:hypothetical protein ACFU6R_03290 [Streptomyces sp. NPDC057499]|uniref:hypothetical protein n=1 Tax=Streptomyces sp. NPDC057499 TaxID=3346150 RepID=UPI0036C9E9CD